MIAQRHRKVFFWLCFCLVGLTVFKIDLYGQNEDYDEDHIESSLPNFSSFNADIEHYQFNDNIEAYYFVGTGRVEIGDSDLLDIEISTALYDFEGGNSATLGDFSFAYTKNFYSKKFLDSGFQGFSPSVKVIVPSGDSEFPGLFGHWIVEPSIFYSWLLKNEKFFISNRWRAFLPLIEVKDVDDPPKFIRFEPRFGFENIKFWTSITLDNRYLFNQDEYVLFTRFDLGYKLNQSNGFTGFHTRRVYNQVLFKTYTGVGYYHIF